MFFKIFILCIGKSKLQKLAYYETGGEYLYRKHNFDSIKGHAFPKSFDNISKTLLVKEIGEVCIE